MNEERKSPRVVYFEGTDGKTYFHLRAGQGEVQFASEGYRDRTDAKRAVRDIYKNLQIALEAEDADG